MLNLHYDKAKHQHLDILNDRTERLEEYEREKELNEIRKVIVKERFVEHNSDKNRQGIKSLVEITEKITDVSPTLEKALNLEELKKNVVKTFNFNASDVLEYIKGKKGKLFEKIKILDPVKFQIALDNTNVNEYALQRLVSVEESTDKSFSPKMKNHLLFESGSKGIDFEEHFHIDTAAHNQIYLTDGFSHIKEDYDYVDQMKYKEGIPFLNPRFQRLQYILYHGITQDLKDMRQVFVNNIIREFESEIGELTRDQRIQIINQIEEEIFENFENIKTIEDCIDLMNEEFSFNKRYPKPIDLDWVDKEIQETRNMYLMNSAEDIKNQREFLLNELNDHKKFINVQLENNEKEFEMPDSDEKEFRLGMDMICQLDEKKGKFWNLIKSYMVDLPEDSETFQKTFLFRQIYQKIIDLYSQKKFQILKEKKPIIQNLYSDEGFEAIDNYLMRNTFSEIIQFFSPHVFFNLSCWGIEKMNSLMNEIKIEIESMRPEEYRRERDNVIDQILQKYGARDEGLGINENLELLDMFAFGFAELYQEYRNKLFFVEDILRKQSHEIDVLERSEAKENLRKKKLFFEKNPDLRNKKNKFETMMEDIGYHFETQKEKEEDIRATDKELEILKRFLEENGISQKYLDKVEEFGKVNEEIEKSEDANFQNKMKNFAQDYLNKGASQRLSSNLKLKELEAQVDQLLSKNSKISEEDKKNIIAIAQEIRLGNNYTLTENYEKLGGSNIPTFDLFRKEKAKAKRERQRLTEKLHLIMGNAEKDEYSIENDNLLEFTPIVNVQVGDNSDNFLHLPSDYIKVEKKDTKNPNLKSLNHFSSMILSSNKDIEENPIVKNLANPKETLDEKKNNVVQNSIFSSSIPLFQKMMKMENVTYELENLETFELSSMFKNYLKNRNIEFEENGDLTDKVDSQMNEAETDLLLKYSHNVDEQIEFLNKGSMRHKDKIQIINFYEKLYNMGNSHELKDETPNQILEDLEEIQILVNKSKTETTPEVMERIIRNFIEACNEYINDQNKKNLSKKNSKNQQVQKEFSPVFLEEKTVLDSIKNLKTRVNLIESLEKNPKDFMSSPIPPEFKLWKTWIGVTEVEMVEVEKKLEVFRIARAASNSRIKQYVLMLKGAEDHREKEIALQKLRKEFIMFRDAYFQKYNHQSSTERSTLFENFIDILMKNLDKSVENPTLSNINHNNVEFENKKIPVSDLIKSMFKDEKSDFYLNAYQKNFTFTPDQNFLSSKTNTLNLVKSMDHNFSSASLDDFLKKVHIAMSGRFNSMKITTRDLSIDEKLELIEMRKELLHLLSESKLKKKSSVDSIIENLQEAGLSDTIPELENLINSGMSMKKALKNHSVLKNFFRKVNISSSASYISNNPEYFTKIAMKQLLTLKNFKNENLFEKMRNNTLEIQLDNKYLPEFKLNKFEIEKTENPFSDQLKMIKNKLNDKLNLNEMTESVLDSKIEKIDSILKSNSINSSDNNVLLTIEKINQKRLKIKKMKDICWKIFQVLFPKSHIEALKKANKNLDIKQACVNDLLEYYNTNNIKVISFDFDKYFLGLNEINEDVQSELLTIYNVMISQSEFNCIKNIDQRGETVFYDKNYPLLRHTFDQIFKKYDYYTKNSKKTEANSEDEILISELRKNEDLNFLIEIEQYLYQDMKELQDLDENEIKLSENNSKNINNWYISNLSILSNKNFDPENKKKNINLLKNFLNLKDLDSKRKIFKKRLSVENQLAKDGIKQVIDNFLNGLDSEYKNKLILSNEINLEIIKSLETVLKDQISQIANKLEKLDRYQKGIMTPEEMEEFQSKVDNVIKSEILNIYDKSLDGISPNQEEQKEMKKYLHSNEKLSLEEQEIENILNGRATITNRMKNESILTLLLRSDINVKPQIVVENKSFYLYKLEEWKKNMKSKGLDHLVPDIDLRSFIQQRKRTRTQIVKNLFGKIDFDQSDEIMVLESSGISPENQETVTLDSIYKRNLLKESLIENLNELISGDEVNLFIILMDMLISKSDDSKSLVENQLCNKLIAMSLKDTNLNSIDSKQKEWIQKEINSVVEIYKSALNSYKTNKNIFENLNEKEILYSLLFSFELYFYQRPEYEYLKNIFDQIKSEFNLNLKEYDRIKSIYLKSDLVTIDHVNTLLDLLSTNDIKSDSKNIQFEYLLKEEDLFDQDFMNNHFSKVSENFLNLSKLPTFDKMLKENKSLVNSFDENILNPLRTSGKSKFLDLNMKKALLVQKLKSIEYLEKTLDRETLNRQNSDSSHLIKFIDKSKIEKFVKNQKNDVKEIVDVEFSQDSIHKNDLKYQEALENEEKEFLPDGYISNNFYSHRLNKKLKAELKFDTLAEKLVFQEINDEPDKINVIDEAISFGRFSNKLVDNHLDTLKNTMPKNIRDTIYDNPENVVNPDFIPGSQNKNNVYTERRVMNIEEMYSGLMTKKKLSNFIYEGLKRKNESKTKITSIDDTHMDMIKFVLDNFKGSGLQKYKIEEWLSKMPKPDKEFKEEIKQQIKNMFEEKNNLDEIMKNNKPNKSSEDYKEQFFSKLRNSLIEESPDKIKEIDEAVKFLKDYVPKKFGEDELLEQLEQDKFISPSYVINYIAHKISLHKAKLKHQVNKFALHKDMNETQKRAYLNNPKKYDLYDQFYDDKASNEYLRLKQLKKIAKESMRFKYDDIHRSLDKKGRDLVVEEESPGYFKDTASFKSYEIEHPDDNIKKFDSMKPQQTVIKKTFEKNFFEDENKRTGIKPVRSIELNRKVQDGEIEDLKNLRFDDKEDLDKKMIYDKDLRETKDWFIRTFVINKQMTLTDLEKIEVDIIIYLFHLNQQKKISIGDVLMEISRRRLNLDPYKFKGISLDDVQKNKVRYNIDIKKNDIKKNEVHIFGEYADFFPDDKLTPFNLMTDKYFVHLISKYLSTKYNSGIPFSDTAVEAFNLIELYFCLFNEKKEPIYSKEEIYEFKEKMVNRDPTIYLADQKNYHLIPENTSPYDFKPNKTIDQSMIKASDYDLYLDVENNVFATKEEQPVSIFQLKTLGDGIEEPDNTIQKNLLDHSVKFIRNSDLFTTKEISDEEMEGVAKKLAEAIIETCPDIYLNDYGEDPGISNPKLSIKNQILRRFDDQVSVKPVLDIWKKPVQVEFNPDVNEYVHEEDLLDSSKRKSHLKQADYQDAKETLERNRIKDIFNEMQEDPFFESKLKEYFSDCHQLEVKNVYEKNYGFMQETDQLIDRRNDPLIKNELVDFLMKYSDLKLKMEKDYYSAYAGSKSKIDVALEKQKEKLFVDKFTADMSDLDYDREKETSLFLKLQKINDFDKKFLSEKKKENNLEEFAYKKKLKPGVHQYLRKIEFIMNKIKDKGEFGGFHPQYYEYSENSTEIPFGFEEFDFRKNGKSWMTEKVNLFMQKIMNTRFNLEKYMSKEELERFDYDLKGVLTRENIIQAVLNELDREITLAQIIRKNYLKATKLDVDTQLEIEISKWDDLQKYFEKSMAKKSPIKRMMALDALQSIKRKGGFDHKKWRSYEKELNSMMHAVEEAVGEDFTFLSLSDEKRKEMTSSENTYSLKDKYKSGRYLNNEFTAKYYGKTIFNSLNQKTNYLNSTVTENGTENLDEDIRIDQSITNLDKLFDRPFPQSEKRSFKSIIKEMGESDQTHNVSKSLGWYFKTMNEKVNPKF